MDLRFVARDGEDLILESDQGQRFQVPIDDSIRDAIKNNPRVTKADFSPKVVQDLIRSGLSIHDVATQLGQDVAAIEPFAAPILDELRYVLEAALNTEVSDGLQMRRFQDLIASFDPTAAFGVSRTENQWYIEAQGQTLMTWKYNPRLRTIEPSNAEAQQIAKQQSRRDVTAPMTPRPTSTHVVASSAAAVDPEPVDGAEQPERTASVHSLVEELRTRRNQESLKPATAKGRASLPSWDEIVLGTTNSESDSD
jgi:hypothetical protein